MNKLRTFALSHTRWIVALLLLWVAAAGFYMSWHDSMTTDEGVHLASGYTALTRRDFRFDPEHPFLFKMLSAAPIVLLHPNPPARDQELWNHSEPTLYDSWEEARTWSELWFYQSGNNASLMIFVARIPAVLVTIFLCWFTYFLGRKWFSEEVGLLWLFFTAFNPTILGHGHLTNTDVPVALGFLVCTYTLWKYGENMTWQNAVYFALTAITALLTKYSSVAIVPIALIYLIWLGRKNRGNGAKITSHAFLMIVVGWVCLWAGYLFHSVYHPGVTQEFLEAEKLNSHLSILTNLGHFWRVLSHIVPIDYVKGLLLVTSSTALGRSTYLLGHFYGSGVWYYFPAMWLFKTQIAGIVLTLLGTYLLLRKRPKITNKEMVLLLTFGVFGFLALVNRLNIGIRHIIVLFPFTSLLMTYGIIWLQKRWKPALAVALILYALPVLIEFPYLLSFGSELVQPYSRSYFYFDDSNLDWGQQAKDAAYVAKEKLHTNVVYVNYMWSPYSLNYYGLETHMFDAKNPPKNVVIMVTATRLPDNDYALFRNEKPIANIGNDTYFYMLH